MGGIKRRLKKQRVISFCLQFDSELYRLLKQMAIQENIPAARLLRNAFRQYLQGRLSQGKLEAPLCNFNDPLSISKEDL